MPIELKDIIHRVYNGRKKSVLNIDSLAISEGEFVGVVDAFSGCSSALVRLIGGIENPEYGTVSLTDHGNKVRCAFYMHNGESTLSESSVERELLASPDATKANRGEKETAARAALELAGFEYEKVRELDPLTISRGDRRLVYIASLLASSPEIFLLDDPMSDMDDSWCSRLMEMLEKLNNSGVTVILACNDTSRLSQYAQRIIIINDGRIYMDSSAKNVFSEYYDLIHLGIEVPEVKRCIQLIRDKGMEMPNNIILYDQFIDRLKILMWRKSK